MPEINITQPQRDNVDSANSDEPTRAGEGNIKDGAQAGMYFLHNCGLIDLMKA